MTDNQPSLERAPLDPYRTPALRIEDAGSYLGVGRSGSYDLVRRGELPTIKLNGRSVVRTVDLMRLLGLPVPSYAAMTLDGPDSSESK